MNAPSQHMFRPRSDYGRLELSGRTALTAADQAKRGDRHARG